MTCGVRCKPLLVTAARAAVLWQHGCGTIEFEGGELSSHDLESPMQLTARCRTRVHVTRRAHATHACMHMHGRRWPAGAGSSGSNWLAGAGGTEARHKPNAWGT